MKNSILTIIVLVFVLFSCNQKKKENEPLHNTMMKNDSTMTMENDTTMMMKDTTMTHQDSKMMDEHAKLYSCPMHPEVHGKLNDKCTKCEMKLTVEVK